MELLGTDLKPGFETPGLKLFREHQFQQALKHFDEEFRQTRDRERKQLLKYYMGVSAYYLGDYAKAKRYFLSVSKVDGDRVARELRYRSIANLAVVEVAQGNYEKGARIYEKFLPLFEKSDFPLDRCQLYCNTGHNYTLLKRYDEAREFLDRAEEVAEQTEMLAKKMLVLYYRGHLELRLENYTISIRLLKKALDCAEETKDGFWRARINWLLGNAYLRKNSLEQSLTYLKRAIRLGKKHSHRMVVARCLNDYAWALYLKGNYTEAKSYAEEALIIQRDLGLQVKNFYDTLDHINQELNSYQEEEAVFNEIERESAREFGIIGISDGITAVIDRIKIFAPSDDPILIFGETGTGKELVAHAIYSQSDRVNRPFIKRNCAAIPENLMESELFGHVKGAFTGATSERKGIFAEADGGTLFLDEIGELPLALQAKLLRVLETGEFYRIGSTELMKVNVRIIAATNRNLTDDISSGKFREDLFYRLNSIQIDLPALRERREDIPILVNHFLMLLNDRYDKYYKRFSEDALHALVDYAYPGNIRELKNIVSTAYLASHGRIIGLKQVTAQFQKPARRRDQDPIAEQPVTAQPAEAIHDNVVPFEADDPGSAMGLKDYAARAEREYIIRVLQHADSVNKACSILKISRPTFYQKIKLYKISLNMKRLV